MTKRRPPKKLVEQAEKLGIVDISQWHFRKPETSPGAGWFCRCEAGPRFRPEGTSLPAFRSVPLEIREIKLFDSVVGRVAQCLRCREAYWETIKQQDNSPKQLQVPARSFNGLRRDSFEFTGELNQILDGIGHSVTDIVKGTRRDPLGHISIEMRAKCTVGLCSSVD